jgi:1-acyl-sn-glycerol-3-phosphate acyltransferase
VLTGKDGRSVLQAIKRPLKFAVAWFILTLTRTLVMTFGRFEVIGRNRLPASGAVILISNHLHLIDPSLVMSVCRRQVHPMAKRELFETPLVGWVFWAVGAFPVRRYSADIGALRAARNILKSGEPVLIFPEGTRSLTGGLQPALPGAATVATLSGAPIVPVAVSGTNDIHLPGVFWEWARGRRPIITIEFGEPFELPSELSEPSQATAAADYMMRRVAALLPERHRGAYGPGSEGTLVYQRAETRTSAPRRKLG